MSPFDAQKSGVLDINTLFGENVYLFPYARYAFLEALKKLKIRSVYLPSFICRDMLAPLNSLAISYVFYEVNNSLCPILKDVKCDAILFINYFGFSQSFTPFKNYKETYNAIILEDNAHGFLSRDLNGQFLGCRGDIGLLSIRKTIFLPNGGALIVNDESLLKNKFKSSDIKLTAEDHKYQRKRKLKNYLFNKYIGIVVLVLRRLVRYLISGDAIPLADPLSEKVLPTNKYLSPILSDRKLSLDVVSESKRRVAMYKTVELYAEKFDIKPIYQLYSGVVPYEFSFIDHGNSERFESYLVKRGYFMLSWPDLPDEVLSTCPEFYKKIKVVPFLW